MGTPSSARIIEDVDLALKALVSWVELPVHGRKFGLSNELTAWETHNFERTFGNRRWYES